jgi:large subunit ribosomal protein L15
MAANRAKSATEKALAYVEKTSRIKIQDLRDNPGARSSGRQVKAQAHNQAGHTIGELSRAAKPPLGWIWGDFYRPWQRMFPGEKSFNGDINLRREYVPLSLLELQRMIDLNWINPNKLIDISTLCNTRLINCIPQFRQFGIHLTDEGAEIFAAKINIEVQWANQMTIGAIEKAGGKIRTAYYDLESLRAAVDPQKWFKDGNPIPGRKRPPYSLMSYYADPNNRGYLADDSDITKSEQRLAEILEYERNVDPDLAELWEKEHKKPNEVFLGLKPGSLVSLADKKVFEPTHPAIIDYFNPAEPLADHLR